MQQNLISEENKTELLTVRFLVGELEELCTSKNIPVKVPFDEDILDFLNCISQKLRESREAKLYPDVVTLGFWMRKASMLKIKDRFNSREIHMGRGLLFHIAPSNVPVNYAYSLIAGLLTGNRNIVRIPSKEFPQISIINAAIKAALNEFPCMLSYVYLVRYERNQKVNDIFSNITDVRVIWGGDNTISELRKSPLPPRSSEVTFADRYSLAIIDSDVYLELDNKERFAEKFYNDTYLSDQNACTSPRIVVWTGKRKAEAKEMFWKSVQALVKSKYSFQSIMGVNKLTSSFIVAATQKNVKIKYHEDNYLIRVQVAMPTDKIMKLKDNSGYFFEYDCEDLMELKELCNNIQCQTIGYLGIKENIEPLLLSGIRGVDRVVPVGATMDFDLVWDGYNLFDRFTRIISVSV